MTFRTPNSDAVGAGSTLVLQDKAKVENMSPTSLFVLALFALSTSAEHEPGSGIEQEAEPDAVRKYVNKATGKCLDSDKYEKAYTHVCNGGSYQKWRSGSDKTIRNVATGKCLDSDGVSVYTKVCNGGRYQQWTNGGEGSLRNVATGHCLDSNADEKVYPLACNGGSYQKWKA